MMRVYTQMSLFKYIPTRVYTHAYICTPTYTYRWIMTHMWRTMTHTWMYTCMSVHTPTNTACVYGAHMNNLWHMHECYTHTDKRQVYIRKHIHTPPCIYVHAQTNAVCPNANLYTPTCVYSHTQTHAVCMYANMCAHILLYMYTHRHSRRIYTQSCASTHIPICTHADKRIVYIYVNTHTKTNAVCIHVDNRRVHVRKDTRENAYIYTHRPTLCVYINIYTHTCLYEHTQTRCVHIQKHLHIPTHIFTHRQKPCVFTKIHTPTHTHTHAYKHKQNSRVWKSPEELENQPYIIKYIHACNSQSHPQLVMEHPWRRVSMMQTTTAVSAGHTSKDATSRCTCTRCATVGQKSMDRGSEAAPRCRRPLPFPLACQHEG